MSGHITLVLGGARSGKSAYAEGLVLSSGLTPVYLATAQAQDKEMQSRIRAHREARKGQGWKTIEEQLELSPILDRLSATDCVLIDCATLWLSNIMMAGQDIDGETETLLAAMGRCAAQTVLVSNETGLGIIPENELARRFRDAQGKLNQQIAARAEVVVAVMAGLPLVLKGQLP